MNLVAFSMNIEDAENVYSLKCALLCHKSWKGKGSLVVMYNDIKPDETNTLFLYGTVQSLIKKKDTNFSLLKTLPNKTDTN